MRIDEIVRYWRGGQAQDPAGRWVHQLNRETFDAHSHDFDLHHPVSPYVGDALNAPVVILGSNAGYNPKTTPMEFPDAKALDACLAGVDDPTSADWTTDAPYYHRTNYGRFIAEGNAVLVNACAYRSRRLGEEPNNLRMLKQLPSVTLTRRWLLEAVLPLARLGDRLIVVKRSRAWALPKTFREANGVYVDPAPRSPLVTGPALKAMTAFLRER